jgi:mucin-2
MLRLATVFASIALVSAKAVEEEAAEVDFEELFEGRFLSGNGTNSTTTTTTTTTTTSTTTTTTTTGSTTTTTTTTGVTAATTSSVTVKFGVVLAIPTGTFGSGITDDATFATDINLATPTDTAVANFKTGFKNAYYSVTFGTTTAPAGTTTTDAYAWSTPASRRRLAAGDIGHGKQLDMTFTTSGLTAAQATTASTTASEASADAIKTAVQTAVTATGLAGSTFVTGATTATVTTDDGSSDTATTTAASSAAGLGLPIVAALFSAVLMF